MLNNMIKEHRQVSGYLTAAIAKTSSIQSVLQLYSKIYNTGI